MGGSGNSLVIKLMSDKDNSSNNPKLHEIPPREVAGRDTLARYQAQFRAAASECLTLLEDDTLDRVYCDYQDDFVSRSIKNGKPLYNFFQVKTKDKRNYQWGVLDIVGLYKNRPPITKKIVDSFAGKLLIHTIKFKDSCSRVIFLTNVHFDDDVENFINAVSKDDTDNCHYGSLVNNFCKAFSPGSPIDISKSKALIRKLELTPNLAIIDPNDESFISTAREAIYKYSEIDLRHGECEEIVQNLMALVERQSFNKLVEDVNEADLDDKAGIGLPQLLDILSISKSAYRLLKENGDAQAIKNASIIQRIMSRAGAQENMTEFVSQCKVEWDIWLRERRHTISEFDLNFLLQEINSIGTEWISEPSTFENLRTKIRQLFDTLQENKISSSLTKDLILGGIFSAIVRNEAQ